MTKLVTINNHTLHLLHGVVILQEAKNYIQHEEIFVSCQKKITFCRVEKNGYGQELFVLDHLYPTLNCKHYFFFQVLPIFLVLFLLQRNSSTFIVFHFLCHRSQRCEISGGFLLLFCQIERI